MLFDGTHINFLIAFFAGVVTFFASCLLPLVPTYLSYLTGIALKRNVHKSEVFINSLLFTLGFIFIFILMGATANVLGAFFAQSRETVQKIGGAFFIFVALFMLGFLKPAFLYKELRIDMVKHHVRIKKLNSLLMGLTFGFAWTPCIGPVLGVVLFWASQSATFASGMLLLLFYGLGIGIPFVLFGLLFEKLSPKLSAANRFGKMLNIIASVLILITGILLLNGKLGFLSIKAVEFLNLYTLSV